MEWLNYSDILAPVFYTIEFLQKYYKKLLETTFLSHISF